MSEFKHFIYVDANFTNIALFTLLKKSLIVVFAFTSMPTQRSMSSSEVKAAFLHILHLDTRYQRRPASRPVM